MNRKIFDQRVGHVSNQRLEICPVALANPLNATLVERKQELLSTVSKTVVDFFLLLGSHLRLDQWEDNPDEG